MTNNMIAMAPAHLAELTQCHQKLAKTMLLPQSSVLVVSELRVSAHDVRPTAASDVCGVPSYVMANVAAFAGPDTRVRTAKHSRPPRGEPAE